MARTNHRPPTTHYSSLTVKYLLPKAGTVQDPPLRKVVMSSKTKCPNCNRYTAQKKGFFSKKLICSYCGATSQEISRTPITEGFIFKRTVGYDVKYKSMGGEDWGSNWRKAKKEALERAAQKCERCGSPTNLHVHHKKPVSKGGKDDQKNLQVLCQKCHKKAHKKGWW